MQDPAKIRAAKWEIVREMKRGKDIYEADIRIAGSVTGQYTEILVTATKIFEIAKQAILEAEEHYDRDIERRMETSGRVIDPGMPVRYSGAIPDIASIINITERNLADLRSHMDRTSDSVAFNGHSQYEDQARNGLKHARNLIDATELHLRTHLWLVWINESLSQASQIHYQMMESIRFENCEDDVFSYVAHPPLIVATVGCTATIEEVGSFYLNKFTDKSHDPDSTNCSDVLRDLKETYPDADPDLIEKIIDVVVGARHDISHYLSKRDNAIPLNDIESYVELCQKCVVMMGSMVREIVRVRIVEFERGVFSLEGK